MLAKAIQALKLSVSLQTLEQRFLQRRYYAFNLYTDKKLAEKRRYIHRNPVSRGLVQQPDNWKWSSIRHWLLGALRTYPASRDQS